MSSVASNARVTPAGDVHWFRSSPWTSWITFFKQRIGWSRGRTRPSRSVCLAESSALILARERQHAQTRLGILTEALPVGVFEADIAGRCHFITKTCADILSVSFLDSFIGSWFDYLHVEDRAEAEANWRASWLQQEPFATQCRVVARDGGQRWVHVQCRPLVSDFGTVYVGTVEDITEQMRTARELQRQTESVEYIRQRQEEISKQFRAVIFELESSLKTSENRLDRCHRSLNSLLEEIDVHIGNISAAADIPSDHRHKTEANDSSLAKLLAQAQAISVLAQQTAEVLELPLPRPDITLLEENAAALSSSQAVTIELGAGVSAICAEENGLKVLLVQDATAGVSHIKPWLETLGATPLVCQSGVEMVILALDAWRSGKPFDAILVTLDPAEDGTLTSIRQLRSTGYQLSIIAILNEASDQYREQCLKSGFTATIVAPVQQDELLRHLCYLPESK